MEKKKNINRIKGLPDKFPFQCYMPTRDEIPVDEPPIFIGMDSGVSNTAFVNIFLFYHGVQIGATYFLIE